MKIEELSAEDQALVKTDFGTDLEKVASEQAAVIQEMYQTGFDKLATAAADDMDKAAEQTKIASESELDGEQEKTASELGSFIERGFYDGLRKLGADRHGNEMHYLMPFVEEKVAEAGAHSAMKAFGGKVMAHLRGAPMKANVAARKAVHAANPAHNVRAAVKGHKPMAGAHGGKRDMAVHRGAEAAKGGAKALGIGAAGAAAYHAAKHKKQEG